MRSRTAPLIRLLPVGIAALLLSACPRGDDPVLPDTSVPTIAISAPEAGTFRIAPAASAPAGTRTQPFAKPAR